jgi:alpha-galactosidase
MKKALTTLLLALLCHTAIIAEDFSLTEGKWSVTYSDNVKGLTIAYNGTTLFNNAYASVAYIKKGASTGSGTIRSGTTLKPTITSYETEDELGKGKCYQFSYYRKGMTLNHLLTFYGDKPYMTACVTLEGDEGIEVESRQMIPMASDAESTPFKGSRNRVIWVPFDNDGHTRYRNHTLTDNNEVTSHEVTAVFDGSSRYGLVAGSIDHDTWKNAVTVKGTEGNRLTRFRCISGYTNSDTRDGLAHGKVGGKKITSARFIIGLFDDWREGLNTFASANALVAPPAEWTKGNPMGWNSWGVMQTVVNYKGVEATARFIKDSLYSRGFHDREGKTVISLDAFAEDNITQEDTKKLGTQVFSDDSYIDGGVKKFGTNQTLGHYYGPFVIWEWILDSKVKGTGINGIPEYKWRDAALKVNGNIYKLSSNGGYASDPTHPAIKANIEYTLKQWSTWGIKYVKADFLNNGIIEGDSWYNPSITTGVQAYNYGMNILLETAKLYDMYIVESISPIFPYQYAHGRRVSCDRFSEIEETEYVLNAISYGWWTDKLYAVNDPDHLVMCKKDNNAKETLGENRARATTGMVTGAYIFGDNFSLKSLKGGAKPGYPEESRKRAIQIMGNKDINEYVRNNTGSFKPLEGDNPSSSQQAESFFVRDTEKYFYLAIFNYSGSSEKRGKVSFERMGIDPANIESIKELWLNEKVTYDNQQLSYNIPTKDARVYRMTKNTNTGIVNIEKEETAISIKGNYDDTVSIVAEKEITLVTIYNTSGTLLSKKIFDGKKEVTLPLPANNNIYIIKTVFADGSSNTTKCK